MRHLVPVLLLMATNLCGFVACKSTSSQTAGTTSDAVTPAGAADLSPFLADYRGYLAFYSKNQFAQAAAKHPDLKHILYGKQNGPYDLQLEPGVSIEKLMAQTHFVPDPHAKNTVGCAPTFLQAITSAQVPFRGSVVLLHGFSACPMQFYEYGVMLAQNGYHVFIPLLPGQGRAPVAAGTSPNGSAPQGSPPNPDLGGWYGAFLPSYDEQDRYLQFGSYINEMMAKLPGDKIVIGLSGGASLAHYMSIEKKGLYTRAMLLTSYYHQRPHNPPNPLLDNDPTFDDNNPPTSQPFLAAMNQQRPFGGYCYRNTYNGRRGICDTKVNSALGLNRFATKFIHLLKETAAAHPEGAWPQTQYVTVENDSGSDTALTREVFEVQQAVTPALVSLCFYGVIPHRGGIPHAFISKFDNQGSNMFWLPSFYAQSLDFIKNGNPMPEGGITSIESQGDHTYHYCTLND